MKKYRILTSREWQGIGHTKEEWDFMWRTAPRFGLFSMLFGRIACCIFSMDMVESFNNFFFNE